MADTIFQERRSVLGQKMAEDGLDALVVSSGFDITYLTGFTAEPGVSVAVLSDAGDYIVTDRRYETQVAEETEGYGCFIWKKGTHSYCENAGLVLKELGARAVGIYGADMTHSDYLGLASQAGAAEFREAPAYLVSMRARKTPQELALIREACRISMLSFYALLDHIRPGVTEKDIADALEQEFRSHGGDGMCFPTIVASGPVNGACPHASVSGRRIEPGDFVTIDFGTGYKGYCSDITRTVCVGTPRPELKRVFDVVSAAKRAGHEALRAGTTPAGLHEAIQHPIAEAGFETPHGFGHSFGLEIHELPFIGPLDQTPYEPGMITTIEPGIYLPGTGGVRQEDDYLVTEEGTERLTFITDELICL